MTTWRVHPEEAHPPSAQAHPPLGSSSEFVASTTGLSVAYRGAPVLENIDFQVPRSAVLGLIGPNGAGKSTLIKAMLGLVRTFAGGSQFFGKPLAKVRERIGYMPQSTSVDWDFPTTVLDVVTMGTYGSLPWFVRPGKTQRQIAREALAECGIGELAPVQIGELSGGQKQRVFLARALAQRADLYFLDEPFQGVDSKTQKTITAVLRQLKNEGKTIVIVHHDLSTVAQLCDWVTLLNRSIVSHGPIGQAFTKENLAVAYDLGSTDLEFMNIWQA